LKYLFKKKRLYLTWSSFPSSDVFVLSRRADLGINKLSGIDGRLSFVSSVIFESNGLVVCCCNGFVVKRLPLGGSCSGSVDPVFNHFHLLDFGGRCNGGLWWTDVIWDIWDSWDSIRSEIVSSLSRGLEFNVDGNCKCWGDDRSVFVGDGGSVDSIIGGWTVVWIVVVVDDDGGLAGVVGDVCMFGLFCVAARFSWEILRNFDINFRTGWSELIWSKPSFFLVSANSRSRLTSAILRKTI
jgi:hypothetical protein